LKFPHNVKLIIFLKKHFYKICLHFLFTLDLSNRLYDLGYTFLCFKKCNTTCCFQKSNLFVFEIRLYILINSLLIFSDALLNHIVYKLSDRLLIFFKCLTIIIYFIIYDFSSYKKEHFNTYLLHGYIKNCKNIQN